MPKDRINRPFLVVARAPGFTLAELLVAVVILTILVAIAFPAARRVIDSGRQAACLNQLKNYGTGLFAYVSDRGSLPRWDGTSSDNPENTKPQYGLWVKPYLGNSKALRCPLATEAEKREPLGFHYAGNAALCQHYPSLKGFPAPSHRIVFAAETYGPDGFYVPGHFNRAIWGNGNGETDPATEGSSRKPQYHPLGERRGLNMLFLDGHAETVGPTRNDWYLSPTYGDATNGGYFYDRSHFSKMKAGTLIVR